jgi:hypothetical protein
MLVPLAGATRTRPISPHGDQPRWRNKAIAPHICGLLGGMIISEKSATFRDHASKIGLVRAGNIGLVLVIILGAVFGADSFRQLVGPRHIGQGCGPGRREHAYILDRHVQLQELAAMPAKDVAVE